MPYAERRSELHRATADHAEYSRDLSPLHRSRAGHVSGRRVRLAYFIVASLWGFVIGAAVVLAASQSEGQYRIPAGVSLLAYIAIGAIVTVGGGGVIAGAYQESKRRR